ncbi:DMT family transporter [Effusibacillus lacus]|uniref:DMT family transporter n=1 Tax=Effusibacillus lacus TaxID=1348429 RepID=UPI000BB88505|nr:DMT family transporter [Effusibacillus lacus]TCS74756.1 drug/metabolite transporter (DMT)-like permease [Effusibacillus lacus]
MGVDRSDRVVYMILFYTASIWGLNVVIIKTLTGYFDVNLVTVLRMGIAFLAIWLFTWIRFRNFPRLTLRQWLWIGLASFLLVYIHQFTLALGLDLSTATNGSLILALNPLFSVLLASMFYGEKLTLTRTSGILIGLFGVCVVVLNKSGSTIGPASLGDLILAFSMFCYVFGTICIRKIADEMDPLVIASYMHLLGTVMLFIHSAITPSFYQIDNWFPGWGPWLLVLFSGVASTALGNVFWYIGIARIGVGRTAIFLNWLPVSGLIFSVLFLGETIKFVHIIGLASVLTGVYLGVRKAGNADSAFPSKTA